MSIRTPPQLEHLHNVPPSEFQQCLAQKPLAKFQQMLPRRDQLRHRKNVLVMPAWDVSRYPYLFLQILPRSGRVNVRGREIGAQPAGAVFEGKLAPQVGLEPPNPQFSAILYVIYIENQG